MTLVARVRVRRSLCLKVPRHAQCAQHALTRNPYVCTYLPSSLACNGTPCAQKLPTGGGAASASMKLRVMLRRLFRLFRS